MVNSENSKRVYAEDLASIIIEDGDTDVTESQMLRWSDDDLYEWLEAWDYEWNGKNWLPVKREINRRAY